jgi:hypothetical protein
MGVNVTIYKTRIIFPNNLHHVTTLEISFKNIHMKHIYQNVWKLCNLFKVLKCENICKSKLHQYSIYAFNMFHSTEITVVYLTFSSLDV